MEARLAAIIAALIVIAAALGYLAALSTVKPATVTRTVTTTSVSTVTVTSVAEKKVTVTTTTTSIVERRFPRSLVDALGRNVTIPEPPRRIATLSPAATEILWAVGGLNRLVACDHYSDYPPIVARWKKEGRVVDLGGYWWTTLNLEKLVSVKPDLVVAEVGAHAKLEKSFEEYGLRVLYIRGGAARSLEDVYHDIWLVGYAIGAEANATKWIDEMRMNVSRVEEKLREANATRVPTLFLVWWSPQGVYVAGASTFIDDMMRRAGATNAASRYAGWPQLSLEELAAMKPRLVIYANAYTNETGMLSMLRKIASTEPFKSLVANGTRICGVYGSAANLLLRPGPRAAMGVQLLAKIIHPELFGTPVARGTGVVCLGG